MTGGICSIGVDTSDLPVQCTCGCAHCCLNKEVLHAVPACLELKKARPLNQKHKLQQQLTVVEQLSNHEDEIKAQEAEPRKLHVKRRTFQCDLCKCEFTRKHSLTVHLLRHTCQQDKDISISKRQVAQKQSCSSTTQERPIPISVQNCETLLLKTINLQCGLCTTTFQSPVALYNHMKSTHSNVPDLKDHLSALESTALPLCNICGKAFHSQSALATHSLVHSGERNHRCCVCLKLFTSRSRLRGHTATHQSSKIFGCAVCGATFAKKDSLSTHLRKHSGERPFTCDICSAGFDRRFTLKNHRVLHSGERPHVCSACGKAFPTRGALTAHERTSHLTTQPWPFTQRRPQDFQPAVCDQCGKVYSNAANLRIHKRTHTDLRPFLCPVCGTAFAKKYTLQCHMRRHSNERPFTCEDCGASFFRRNTLATHQRRHTGERPHCCKLCGRGFIQSASLAYHMEHHDHASGSQPSTARKSPREHASLSGRASTSSSGR